MAAGYEYFLVASTCIIADKFNIPLIIQDENPALTKGLVSKNGDNTDDAFGMMNMDILKGKNGFDLCDEVIKK